jgi:hypothetical protein
MHQYRDYRRELWDLVDDGAVDNEYLMCALINWMSQDDLRKCLQRNDITLYADMEQEEEEEEEESVV